MKNLSLYKIVVPIFLFCAMAVLLPARLVAQNYTWVNVDYPGASISAPAAVNDSGDVVGWWQDGEGNVHGYYWDGTNYTSFDYPGADATLAEGINNAGVISGEYETNSGTQTHGFVLVNGTFTSYDYPGYVGQTNGQGINNNGELVGYYNFTSTAGFFDANGSFSSFDYPHAETYPSALNDSGEAVGYYQLVTTGQYLGFVYSNATFTTIEYPNDCSTVANGIDNAGVVVGYSCVNGPPYAVVWLWQNGEFTATVNSDASPRPSGINNKGQLVGIYFPSGFYHGFLATPVSQSAQFVPVTPCRIVDTRKPNGTFGGPAIPGNTFRSFPLAQSGNPCDIPSTAIAYSLNVTVVPHTTLGYLTIWPAGRSEPNVSTMNSPDGRVKANAAIVPAGTPSGSVSVYVTDTTDVILDIDGYFAAPGSGTYQFYTLSPCRIVDTRGGHDQGTLRAGVERDYTIPPNCGVPSSAKAYSFNVTVLPAAGGLDYLTVWPKGEPMPSVSTLNDNTGTVVANAAIVPAGSEQATAFYPHNNNTDLLVDVDGYFAAPGGQNALSLYPVAPCRVLDTRQVGNGQPFSGLWNPPNGVDVLTSPCAPPSTAKAFVFNATVVPSGSMPFLTLWPHGEGQPVVSTLNAYDGFITSNMAIVPTNDGSIDAYADGLTQLILDISGYFAP